MQCCKLVFQLDMQAVRSGDVARATSTGAMGLNGLCHGANHFRFCPMPR